MSKTNHWGNTTANNAPGDTLTAEKLRETMRNLQAFVQPDAFDIYGHDLEDQERAFILDRRKLNEGLFGVRDREYSWIRRLLDGPELDRKMLVVPRPRLEETYFALRAKGIDVRLEPRYGAPSANDTGEHHG